MIIVLHLSYYKGSWLVWGETSPADEKAAGRGRKRKKKAGEVEASLFDVSAGLLGNALALAGIEIGTVEKNSRMMEAWLPTASGRVAASSRVVAEPPESQEQMDLQPWKVTTVALSATQAVSLLAACMGRRTLAPGVVVSRDAAYWIQVLRLAGSLVARERFLPGIAKTGKKYCACWEPVLTGDDLGRLRILSEAMPSACRAVTEKGLLPAAAPLAVVTEAVGAFVDAVVRAGAGVLPAAPLGRTGLHDRWLAALQAQEGNLEDTEANLAGFAAQVKEWQRKVYYLSNAPFRFCFRLEEPSTGEKWAVRYLLQAADDPSLLVPVEEAWQARGKKAQPFKNRNVSVRELVLTALGQVAGLCPHIEESLRTPVPQGYTLDNEGAYEFLTEKAPLLEQSGFVLQVPAWWTKKSARTGLTAKARLNPAKMQAPAGLTSDRVIAFDWEIALGEEVLTEQELEMLAEMKSGLVKLRGRWVAVDAAGIRTFLAERQKGEKLLTAGEAVRLALGAVRSPGGLVFAGLEAEGWLRDLLDRLEGHAPWQEIPPPSGFQGQMRPYQLRGYSWLDFLCQWGFGACLADDMGLGKTIQTLALLQHYREKGEKRPALLVCPTSLVGNWLKEAARFTPGLSLLVQHGSDRIKEINKFARAAEDQAVVLTSYGLLHRDHELFRQVRWSGIILDEAQNIKNAGTRQAQAACALQAGYRVALTGTPVENNVGDLWSLMQFMNPGLLGSQAGFKRDFFFPIQVNRDDKAAQKLKRLTGPFILRRVKTDKSIIDDLPDKMEMKVYCTLTREQASLYAAVVKEVEEGLDKVEGMERRGLILSALSRLKQICNHPAQFLKDNSALAGRSGKMQRLTEMCEEILEMGERALIFTQFAEMGEILRRHLMETFGCQVLFLHGGVPSKERNQMVELFQDESGPPLFILSLKAGGTGLNLTRAGYVFHFDRWWNPAVEDQATDRAFRIGQTKHVQVHKFVVAGTVEERIDEMIERKKEVAGRIVGSGEGWLTELSTNELKEIWALRPETVGD